MDLQYILESYKQKTVLSVGNVDRIEISMLIFLHFITTFFHTDHSSLIRIHHLIHTNVTYELDESINIGKEKYKHA